MRERKRGGGVPHIVCLGHSFIELMMVCILFCASVHFSRMRRVVSCSSLVSYWMLMKFSSLNVVMKAWISVSIWGIWIGVCVGW